MNLSTSRNIGQAFTLVELLVLIAFLAVLAMLVRPVNPGRRQKASLVDCMDNLRQTGLGFVMWSEDHGGSWPWQVSTNQGGTTELMLNGRAADHFLTLSNYLKNARLLVCPTDPARRATNSYPDFGNQNLSYFAGLDEITNNPRSILSGDRHLQMSGQPVKPGLLVVSNRATFGWTKELHARSSEPVGNLSFADGHVESVRAVKLSSYFERQPAAANRLVIP